MTDQVFSGNKQTTTTNLTTAGSIFGVDRAVANAPLVWERPTSSTDTTLSQRPSGDTIVPTMGNVLQGLAHFYNMSANEREAYRQKLVDGHYLSKGKHTQQQVYAAWKGAVIDASRSRMTVDEALQFGANSAPTDASGSTVQPMRATNPIDLAAIAQETAQKVWGRGLTDEEESRITHSLAGFERPYLAAHGSTAPPSAAGFQKQAQSLLRDMHPVEAGANDLLSVVEAMNQIFGGSGGG